MRSPVTSRVIKPQQCVFAFGIPTSKQAFLESRFAVGDSYVRKFVDWKQYKTLFARDAARAQRKAKTLGVNVRRHVSCQEFVALFDGEFDVIILFSHWTGEGIEFKGGFGTAAHVVESISNPTFAEFADLTICKSRTFGDQLKRRFIHCTVSVGDVNLSPDRWLAYYLALFKILKQNNLCYFDAVKENLEHFLTRSWMGRVKSALVEDFKRRRGLGAKPLGPEAS